MRLVMLVVLLGVVGGALASVTGTPPNLLGDTNVNNTTVWFDETYTLEGSVSIYAGGNLTLDNTKLIFNSTPTDSYGLFVGKGNATANGGWLIIQNGSNITAWNPENHTWVYAEYEYPPSSESPVIQASDSYFSELGKHDHGGDAPKRYGLEIRHTTSETFFDNITIRDSHNGIYLGDDGEAVNITNCTIDNISRCGIFTKYVGAYIYNNDITNVKLSIYAQYTDGLQIINNRFDAGTWRLGSYVIDFLGSPYDWDTMDRNFLIKNNTFIHFQRGVVCNQGARDGVIEDNTMDDCIGGSVVFNAALDCRNTNITIKNNNITDSQVGLLIRGDNHIAYSNKIINPMHPTGYTAGINIDDAHNTTIYDTDISNINQTTTYAIYSENSINTSVTNVTISDFMCGMYIYNMSNMCIVDGNITNSTTYSINFKGLNTGIKFINPTLNTSKINFTDAVDMFLPYYYLDVKVVDSSGTPISDATVTIVNNINGNYPTINISGDNKTSFTTGSDGHTPMPSGNESDSIAILDYTNNSTSITQMSYTVTASKTNYNDNSDTVTPNDTWYRSNANTYKNTTTITLGNWNPSNNGIHYNVSNPIMITTNTTMNVFSRTVTEQDNNVTSFKLVVTS